MSFVVFVLFLLSHDIFPVELHANTGLAFHIFSENTQIDNKVYPPQWFLHLGSVCYQRSFQGVHVFICQKTFFFFFFCWASISSFSQSIPNWKSNRKEMIKISIKVLYLHIPFDLHGEPKFKFPSNECKHLDQCHFLLFQNWTKHH